MTKYKVVITDFEYEDTLNEERAFREAGLDCEIVHLHTRDSEKIAEGAKDADGIIVHLADMPRELIMRLEKTKCITRYGLGMDGFDMEAATEKGICICNVDGYCIDEVATHALSMILYFGCRLPLYNEWTKGGSWYHPPGTSHNLKTQTLGIVSYGRIARALKERALPLFKEILVYSESVPREEIEEDRVRAVDFDTLLRESDYISIHSPLSERTRHLFDREAFAGMKSSAFLINVGRGAVVCEKDLIEALESGKIAGAGLDVLEKEPPEPDNPLLGMNNVIVSPHVAWYSAEAQSTIQSTPAEEIARVLKGERPKNLCNPEVLKLISGSPDGVGGHEDEAAYRKGDHS